jgi:hypothetical protein
MKEKFNIIIIFQKNIFYYTIWIKLVMFINIHCSKKN